MKSKIESLLFISAKPISLRTLSKSLNAEPGEVESAINQLMMDYNMQGRGIMINKIDQKNDCRYQMVTNSSNTDFVKKYTKQEINAELTRPSLETLTIIAYRGPITKPELEKIRGVNCGLIIRNLLIRDLITQEVDSKTGDTYLTISPAFLQWLGINKLSELPDYERLNNNENLKKIAEIG